MTKDVLVSRSVQYTKLGPENQTDKLKKYRQQKKRQSFRKLFCNQVKTFLLFKRRQNVIFRQLFKGVGGRAYTAGSEAKIRRRRRFTRRRRVARRRRRQRCAPICLTDRNEGDHEAEDEEDGGSA